MTPPKCYATLFALALALGGAAPDADAGKNKKKTATKVKKSKKAKTTDKVKPAKNYDFLADDIDGQRVRPDDTTIFGIKNVKHTSLIRLREHFINEIVRSAEML